METNDKRTDAKDPSEHERTKNIHHNLDVGMREKKVDDKFPESSLSKNSPTDSSASKQNSPSGNASEKVNSSRSTNPADKAETFEQLADDVVGSVGSRVTSSPDDIAGVADITKDLGQRH
jgi:hypothetical protein